MVDKVATVEAAAIFSLKLDVDNANAVGVSLPSLTYPFSTLRSISLQITITLTLFVLFYVISV